MAVVLMPKRRQTIPIAHADDVPTTAQMTSYDWLVWTYGGYTTSIIAPMMQRPGWFWLLRAAPFLWQAIEHAYGRQLECVKVAAMGKRTDRILKIAPLRLSPDHQPASDCPESILILSETDAVLRWSAVPIRAISISRARLVQHVGGIICRTVGLFPKKSPNLKAPRPI
jgi:hypothetical protein